MEMVCPAHNRGSAQSIRTPRELSSLFFRLFHRRVSQNSLYAAPAVCYTGGMKIMKTLLGAGGMLGLAAALAGGTAYALSGPAPVDENMRDVRVADLPNYDVPKIDIKDKGKHAKNVILMIGDGMASEHLWAAWMLNRGKGFILGMPVTGFSITTSASDAVTDSAAGGTALACGQKTNNHFLGMTPDKKPIENLAEYYRAKGKATGIVLTKDITDATPAAFYAHVDDRNKKKEIAKALVDANFTVVYGGGAKTLSDEQKQAIRDAGTVAEFTHDGNPPAVAERGEDYLCNYVGKALKVLEKNPRGFFLMVEGSQIDHHAHNGKAKETLHETMDFDRAVGVVLQWMQKHPDTLLVVTADHQTGGLAIKSGNKDHGSVHVIFGTHSHTGFSVPVYAAGNGSHKFTGVKDNTEISKLMR